jgi:hypothetical protein
MATFIACLLSDDGDVLTEKTFEARSRVDAIGIAQRIALDEASDCCAFEVWHGKMKIAHRGLPTN